MSRGYIFVRHSDSNAFVFVPGLSITFDSASRASETMFITGYETGEKHEVRDKFSNERTFWSQAEVNEKIGVTEHSKHRLPSKFARFSVTEPTSAAA